MRPSISIDPSEDGEPLGSDVNACDGPRGQAADRRPFPEDWLSSTNVDDSTIVPTVWSRAGFASTLDANRDSRR